MLFYTKSNQFFTLGQILSQVRIAISKDFAQPVWIRAEMLKLNKYSTSGHAFPELVEKTSGKIVAKCQSMIWADDLVRICDNFTASTGKVLKDGIEILFFAEIRFHELYGMRLRIIDIDPQFTLGQMAMLRKKAIERLKAEELFDKNKHTYLAEVPNRLAVISATTSRGLHDLKNIIFKYGDIFNLKLTLFNAVLQGEKGAETIANRIMQISKQKQNYDAILIIRGGGDDTGMDCYDNYNLAKTVCESPLPVITGIGHSTNETITEMVAHTNKITPTDVGYFILEKFIDQLMFLKDITAKITANALMCVSEEEQNLYEFAQNIADTAKDAFYVQKNFLLNIGSVFQNVAAKQTAMAIIETNKSKSRLENAFQKIVLTQNYKNEKLLAYFESVAKKEIVGCKNKIEILQNKVSILDPKKILSRGYSITLINGKIARSAKNIEEGIKIETILKDGRIKSIVKK